MKDTTKTLSRSFSFYSFGVILSRLSGLARDVCLAFFFGTSVLIADFMVAFRFANLLRRVIAESPLSSSFVPTFESVKKRSLKEGFVFARDLFYTLCVLSALLVIVLILGSSILNQFLNDFHSFKKILSLTCLMFPSLIFICLYGLSSSFLQCEKKYFLPASAPVFFNLTWIMWMAYAAMHKERCQALLGVGVIFSFFVQWVIVAFPIYRMFRTSMSVKEIFSFRLFHGSLSGMVKPFFMGAIGIGATQINSLLDSVFARFADASGPAFLWYAIRIQQVPIALFGVAITAALLPPLTRAIKASDTEHFKTLFKHGYKKSFAFMSFSFFGIVSLGSLATVVIFARGEFTSISCVSTSKCLLAYSLGLFPHAATLILASSFYASHDFETPMKASLFSVLINAFANAFLVFGLHMGAVSVALATSLTSLFNFFYLYIVFRKKWGRDVFEITSYLKSFACGLFAAGATYLYFLCLGKEDLFFLHKAAAGKGAFVLNLAYLFSGSVIFLLFFVLMEKIFKEKQVLTLFDRRDH
ncbi:murein biosynthesis integral membrane protein MurJ [Candidatus Aerophobetes bacterium]|uniref:Lipid II flippase n=1 Tax=Aerophobetes bacterium TaxID=2030807 RepID=A0A2A4YBZ3_UNCAE|nr:MAG: murein biosynthesis integral membrane protein MurJ [Candidatus Aerophobetes bacterium]